MGSSISIRSWLADRANIATLTAIVGITILAGIARIAPLPNEPLWLDELHTSWTVIAGIDDVAPRARLGNQSPLYFYLPWLTTHTLGQNELALRLPSLVAGLVLVPLVFTAATWFSHSRLAGLSAALLVALDQDCIFYAQEARPYALVQVLAVINALCFWRLLSAPSLVIRAAWVLSGALLFYTHYTAALILVAEGVYLGGFMLWVWLGGLFSPAGKSAAKTAFSKLLQVTFDATIIVMLCLPAVPHLLEIFGRRKNWHQFISSPDGQEFGDLLPFVPLVVVPVLVVAVASFIRRWQLQTAVTDEPLRRTLAFIGCWITVPVAVVTLSTWFDLAPLFHRRYIIGVLPALIILSTVFAALFRSSRLRGAYLLLILSASFTVNEPLLAVAASGEWPASRNQDWKAAIEFVNSSSSETERVFIYTGLIETEGYLDQHDPLKDEYCTLPAHGILTISPTLQVFPCLPFGVKPIGSTEPILLGKYLSYFQNPIWVVKLRGEENGVQALVPPYGIPLRGDRWVELTIKTHRFGEVEVTRVTHRSNL